MLQYDVALSLCLPLFTDVDKFGNDLIQNDFKYNTLNQKRTNFPQLS